LDAKQQLLLLKSQAKGVKRSRVPNARVLKAVDDQIAHQEKLLSIFQEQSEQQLRNRQQTLELQIQDLQAQIAEWNLKALDASKKLSGFEALKENEKRLQSMFDQLQATVHTD
jgi:flagellar biosynthesis/type III secretory pathway protein FliH